MAVKGGRRMATIFLQVLILVLSFITCLTDEIEVEANAFRVYRFPKQLTTQKNHIKLRFKTIHSNGLIMFAQGANKKDFLSLELYRGKIRLAADFGRGTENKLRPIAGNYDMYLGKDLADNEWHTVEVVRNIRESIIYIDRGRGKMEKSIFMKSPPTYNELSISMVSFGGYYSFATSEISTNQALSRKGLKACFSEATFSQEWPEDDNKEINFLDSNSVKTIGTVKDFCSDTTPPYKPMFFPSSPMHLALVENYKQKGFLLSLKFRTVISDIIIANYTTVTSNEKVQLQLNRRGKVQLKFRLLNDVVQIIETAKEDYHDGQWHSASFHIDNEKTADDDYVVKFSVDAKTRLTKMSRNFPFDGNINVGFGFTGCMRDIEINNHDIFKLPKTETSVDDFFKVSSVGVMLNSCSLKDYCNPNPCQNGGRCNQTEDNVICNCRETLYDGSTCHRPRFNYTCAGVRASGEQRSDVYYIDMDGMGPMEPVRALCDLGKTVETTVTQINNTKMVDQDVLTKSGRNNINIEYQASITQTRELIKNSASCNQFIKYQCKGTPLFRSPAGPPAVSWMGGDDIVHYYWGGALGKRGYCACGVKGDCKVGNRAIGKYCNCDSLISTQQVIDEGNFTIKGHLPVRKVLFTEVLKAQRVEGSLRVGHLRCAGFGARNIAATFRKPWSFLGMDHPDQPFDNIFAGGISLEFKTTYAYNYMTLVHAHGPFSGDYCKVMIWSRTMIRVLLNFGFGQIKQDVDISATGRTIDDNEWHEFSLMFNLKELNVTLDSIEKIQGLPLQEDPVQFNVDDKAVYVGGSYHDKNGFIGCVRSFYVNGRIHDIYSAAEGMEDSGVYQGCGSACAILDQPCNYGECIDYYDSVKCNCSISPYEGKYCQNSSNAKQFTTGNNVICTFFEGEDNKVEPVNTGIFVIGFKTSEKNAALAQLLATDYRHFTLVLEDGYLTLYFSMKQKLEAESTFAKDDEVNVMRLNTRQLSDDIHHVARVRFTTNFIYLEAPDTKMSTAVNMTEHTYNVPETNKPSLTPIQDSFGTPFQFKVGQAEKRKFKEDIPTSFSGCMSGAKIVLHPRSTTANKFPKSIEIDMFKNLDSETDEASVKTYPAFTGTYPQDGECGKPLPTPGPMPTVGGPSQFFTRSPGLDPVRITTADTAETVIICVIIIIVATVLLGFLYLTYVYVEKSRVAYRRLKKEEKPRSMQMKDLSKSPGPAGVSYQPPPSSYNAPPPSSSYNQPPPSTYNAHDQDGENWFL